MGPTLIGLSIGIVILAVVFSVLQRLWPADPDQRTLRPGMLSDLGYFLLTPFITKQLTRLAVIAALIPLAYAYGMDVRNFASGHGTIGAQSLPMQALQIVVLSDFLRYWVHRLFHGGWWWKVHAVHHSSPTMDWLAAVRVHPINDVVPAVLTVPPLIAMGYNPAAVAAFLPFLTAYAIMLHANLSWDYGPFRYVLASPAFHRWHHTKAEEGQDKNFAGLFPLWDLMFGTFYMPRGRQAEVFGVDDPVPKNIFGQLLYPFFSSRR
jgi:sterol desaturase/sphingolipid hydroxylase (fatty acid hydroxylase superfamily)